MYKILWGFEIQTDHAINTKGIDLVLINMKKRTCYLGDFVVLADYGVKVKEGKKLEKYLDLARELKMSWNMKVTVIPIGVGRLGTVLKNLEKRVGKLEIRGRIETIQTSVILKTATIFRRILKN